MPIKYFPTLRKSTNVKIINKSIVNKPNGFTKRTKAWPTTGRVFSSTSSTLQNQSNIYTNSIRKIPSSCTQLYSKYVSSGSVEDYTNYIDCYNNQYPTSITSIQKSNDIKLNKKFTADGTIKTFPSKCNSMICDWLYKSKTDDIQKGYNDIPEYNNVDECGKMIKNMVYSPGAGKDIQTDWSMPNGISSGVILNPKIIRYY